MADRYAMRLKSALGLVEAVVPSPQDHTKFEVAAALVGHVRAVASHCAEADWESAVGLLRGLGAGQMERGDYRGALETASLERRLVERFVDEPSAQHVLTLCSEAVALKELGRYQDAERVLRHVHALLLFLPGRELSDTVLAALIPKSAFARMRAFDLRGMVYRRLGKLEESVCDLARSVTLRTALQPDSHAFLAGAHANLGNAQLAHGLKDEALRSLWTAVCLTRRALPHDYLEVGRALGNLGAAQLSVGQLDAAEESLKEAMVIKREAYTDDHPETAITLVSMAGVKLKRANLGTAEAGRELRESARVDLLEGLRIRKASFRPDHPEIAEIEIQLGFVEFAAGHARGPERMVRGRSILAQLFKPDHPSITGCDSKLQQIGMITYQERLVAQHEGFLGPQNVDTAKARNNLATMFADVGITNLAIDNFRSVVQVLTRLAPDDPDTAIAVANLKAMEDQRRDAVALMTEGMEPPDDVVHQYG